MTTGQERSAIPSDQRPAHCGEHHSDHGSDAMSDLTVFLIAVNDNNPNYSACLAALQAQEPPVNIVPIYNQAPMDRAFQAMLDQCQTPYFCQVDQDMVLESDACSVMVTDIKRQSEQVAFVVYMLTDVHLDMPIQGVKCYRHAVVKQFPYVEGLSCEKSQLTRIREGGYFIVERNAVLGEHSPRWTPELISERYFDLMEKWKKFGYGWLENLPAKLLGMYASDPSDINKYAFLGAWASASRPEVLRTREKDFRVRTKEYLIARGMFSQPTQATLYLTDKCNLKCGWCLRQGNMAQVAPAPVFDATIVDELVRRFPGVRSVCLCGFGETLLHPDPGGIIDRCKRYGLWVGLITNGVLLEQAVPTLLAHRPSQLSISLNAATAGEHAWETGVDGAWDKVMTGIATLRLHRAGLQSLRSTDNGIPLFLSRVCTADNLDGVAEFLELAVELGVDGVDLHNILPHSVETPEKEAAFLATALTVKHCEQLAALRSLPGAELVRSWPIPIDPDCLVRHCEFPFTSISVDGNRSIGICNSVMPPSPANGNLRDPKCWQNEYAQAMRDMFAKDELPPWCRYCFRNFQ
jgi:MoaA/NifB/PqqE/SkfB family radical SAM enzyme